MNELCHMHKTGHKITVAQCDTRLNSVEDFNPRKDWEVKGRGGTSFQPVVDHYNENLNFKKIKINSEKVHTEIKTYTYIDI